MISRATLLLFLCFVAPIHAQDPHINPEMNVDSGVLSKWLHSSDPRLVAWAADFARRRHDPGVISEIPGVLGHWPTTAATGGDKERMAQRRAILALLDAIIQEKAAVPISTIQSIADRFPAQATLLITRMPLTSSRSTLMDWAFQNSDAIVGTRARAAAMMLARHPDPSFAYRVVEGLVQHVTVHIVNRPTGFGGGMGAGCGDGVIIPPFPGWPVVYDYRLEADGAPDRETVAVIPVARLADHRIDALRFEDNGFRGGCSISESDGSFRHELIAYMVGKKPGEMSWQANESLSVVWTTKAAYERKLGSFIESDRVKMLDTLRELKERNLFDDRMVDGRFPEISMSFDCQIHPCPVPELQKSRR